MPIHKIVYTPEAEAQLVDLYRYMALHFMSVKELSRLEVLRDPDSLRLTAAAIADATSRT